MDDYYALTEGRWLSDSIIHAGQMMLKEAFPMIGGFQAKILGEVLAFEPETTEFVQILNVASSHWITVSTIGCCFGEINIFDSMLHKDLPDRTKEKIASLLYSPLKKISLKFHPVQRQRGSNDCGLFALAFATSLCNGTCPTEMMYTQKSMRTHLLDCLVNRKMSTFPGRARAPRMNELSVVHVYLVCKCRLPEEGKMAQCDLCNERFHQTCESIPDGVWMDKDKWLCTACSKYLSDT